MNNSIKCLAILISFFGIMNSGWTQVTYDGCRDFRGTPVVSVLDYSINDVAIARIENGHAVIRYNPRVLAQMSEPTRRFFYVHECATMLFSILFKIQVYKTKGLQIAGLSIP